MRRAAVMAAGVWALGLATAACTEHRVKVDPIEVKPIHVTMDINLKVDRRLDDFFAFEDEIDPNTGAEP